MRHYTLSSAFVIEPVLATLIRSSVQLAGGSLQYVDSTAGLLHQAWNLRQAWPLHCHFSCSTSYNGNSGSSPANLIFDFVFQRYSEHRYRQHYSALNVWTSPTDSVHVPASLENESSDLTFSILKCPLSILIFRIIFLWKENFNLLLLRFSMNC